MTDKPDLSKIQPPSDIPPDQPDPKTNAEVQELKRKPLTPTERESLAHRAHADALQ